MCLLPFRSDSCLQLFHGDTLWVGALREIHSHAAVVVLVLTSLGQPILLPQSFVDEWSGFFTTTTASDRSDSRSPQSRPPIAAAEMLRNFPEFMLQWPTEANLTDSLATSPPKHRCSIFNANIPHRFQITDHSTTYATDAVFGSKSQSFHEAWRSNKQGSGRHDTDAARHATILAYAMSGADAQSDRLPSTNSTTTGAIIKTAACAIKNFTFSHHFPHQTQHAVSCWSLWQHFPNAAHILILRQDDYAKFSNASTFSRGMIQVLQASGVSILQTTVDDFVQNQASNMEETVLVETPAADFQGFATAHEGDVPSLRHSVLAAFGLDGYSDAYCSPYLLSDGTAAAASDGMAGETITEMRQPRIAIATRVETRSLIGAHTMASHLRDQLKLTYTPPVLLFETLSFQQQIEAFNNVDILVSAHDALLTGIFFMHRCSAVIDVFPTGYGRTRYFGTLSAISGVNHSYVYLGNDMVAESARNKRPRQIWKARIAHLCAPVHALVEAVRLQIDQWNKCCDINAA